MQVVKWLHSVGRGGYHVLQYRQHDLLATTMSRRKASRNQCDGNTTIINDSEKESPMKSMKKILSIAAALVLTLSFTTALAAPANRLEAIKAAGKLVVATSPDYAPYEFLDNEGNPVGADISLAKYLAEQLGVELQLEALSFDAVLAAVVTGTADIGIAGMVPKDERKETMDFTDVYYNDGNQCIVILKDNADKLKTLEDFAGKTVAAQNGTLQQELVTKQLAGATMEPIVAIPDAIMMVMTGKVDGLALASVVADQYIANYPDQLAICETRFDYESLGVAMAAPKDSPELIAALNEIVKEVVESGKYNTWMQEAQELSASMNK